MADHPTDQLTDGQTGHREVSLPITCAPVGSWKNNFSAFLGNKYRPTNRPTDNQQTDMRGHREITLPRTQGAFPIFENI